MWILLGIILTPWVFAATWLIDKLLRGQNPNDTTLPVDEIARRARPEAQHAERTQELLADLSSGGGTSTTAQHSHA